MKSLVISIFVAVMLVGLAFLSTHGGANSQSDLAVKNSLIVDGKQIVEIHARGGYQPRNSIAKAGISTVLRFDTSGTFDCSSSVRIPSLNISKNLPSSGTTDIELGISQQGVLKGMCGMGMYPFEINFQNNI